MCNLCSSTKPVEAMRRLFDVAPELDFLGNAQPLAAIWPKYEAPVVRLNGSKERELVRLSWGFRTTKKSKKTGNVIAPAAWNNARDDKVRSAPLWRESFEQRRCLIPGTAFCEAKGRNPASYYWFGLSSEETASLFAFAGMWTLSKFLTKDGPEECAAFTMLTTSANERVKPVHPDRMPVIIDPESYEVWLSGTSGDAHALCRPYPSDKMVILASGEDVRALPEKFH